MGCGKTSEPMQGIGGRQSTKHQRDLGEVRTVLLMERKGRELSGREGLSAVKNI